MSRVIIASLLLTSFAGAPASISASGRPNEWLDHVSGHEGPAEYVPGEVLVKFKDGTPTESRKAVIESAGALAVRGASKLRGLRDALLLRLDGKVSVEDAVRYLGHQSEVAYAEPNYLGRLLYEPSDPEFEQQWGLRNTGQEIGGVEGVPGADIDAMGAWDYEQVHQNPVTVAVLDSGINPGHPDLDSTLWVNSDEIDGNSIDDDRNGYVDDVNGYNLAGISQRAYQYFSEGEYRTMYKALGSGTGSSAFAQSIVGTGCELTHLGVMLSAHNSPTGDIRVSIRSDLDDSGPDFTIAASEVPAAPTEIYRPLSAPVMLQDQVTYYVVVETADTDPENHYLLYDYQSTLTQWFAYWDGYEYVWDGDSWTPIWSDDLYFRTNPNSNPYDDNSHGTSVSGVIAAAHNDLGIAGVAPNASVMPVKVTDSSGAFTVAELCEGLRYAADGGAQVLTMCLSCPASQALQDAVDYAHDNGLVLLAAAGNGGSSTLWYPAACRHVIGVGATDNRDERASFSNYNESVDVTAPGKDIYTTHRSGGYSMISGTSLAVPHVAGLAALLLSAKPDYIPEKVEEVLERNAEDLGTPGRDDYFGHGRIDAHRTILAALTPNIESLDPPQGESGVEVAIKGDSFGAARGDSFVSFGSLRPDIVNWTDSLITCLLPEAERGRWPVAVTTAYGRSNEVEYSVTCPNWYLAEGSTAWGFDTAINIENPNESDLNARVSFMVAEGTARSSVVTLPAMSLTILNPRDYLGSCDFSTRVECLEGLNIAVDRSMSWDSGFAGGLGEHCSIGATAPSRTWYLPEGSSAWGFECWLLVQNPNADEAKCRITYMVEGSSPVVTSRTVPAGARVSMNMADHIGQADASIKVESDLPVVPERAMYTRWISPENGEPMRREGHSSIGVNEPSKECYFAEGSTAWGFITYLLMQNPNKTAASVTINCMTDNGGFDEQEYELPPESRRTLRLNDIHPDLDMAVRVRSDKPIAAERSMCWAVPSIPDSGLAIHDSIGVAAPHTTYFLPGGRTAGGEGGVETYVTVQNPHTSDVEIKVSYLTTTGTDNTVFGDTLEARSRKTYRMGDRLSNERAAARVECLTPGRGIVVERSTYSPMRWGGANTIGGFTD